MFNDVKSFGRTLGLQGRQMPLQWFWEHRDCFAYDSEDRIIIPSYERLVNRANHLWHYFYLSFYFKRNMLSRKIALDKTTRPWIGKVMSELAHHPVKLRPLRKNAAEGSISIIVSNVLRQNVYSSVILSHLASLAITEKCDQLNVVFISDTAPIAHYNNGRIRRLLASSIDQYLMRCQQTLDRDLSHAAKKVSICVPKTASDLDFMLGSRVVRFEGNILRSQHSFASSIYANRIVATATFNSLVRTSPHSDLILSRRDYGLSEKEVKYFFPVKPRRMNTFFHTKSRPTRIAITVYGGSRLKTFFRRLGKDELRSIRSFLSSPSIDEWLLVGADYPEELQRVIQSLLGADIARKITVKGRSKLPPLYERSAVFLALPGIRGGAAGCVDALSEGLAVVHGADVNSDISNLLPPEDPIFTRDLAAVLKRCEQILSDQASFNSTLSKQWSFLKKRTSLALSGNSIIEAFERKINEPTDRETL